MPKPKDDGRAEELAIQAEIREVVDALIQQRERLAGLLKRANRLPGYRRVSAAWDRGDEWAESVGWRIRCDLMDAAHGPIQDAGDGPVLGGVIACLRDLAGLTPEACAEQETANREQGRRIKAEVAEEKRRGLAAAKAEQSAGTRPKTVREALLLVGRLVNSTAEACPPALPFRA